MRVAFLGTPEFAVPSLRALLAAPHEVVAVVTQPDRARGRSRSALQPPPVKVHAIEAGIPVLQPERPRGDTFLAVFRELRCDLAVVVAYGHILPAELLALAPRGFVNVHASLLPRWRGAAPIQWSILAGDTETGVSIMRIEAGLDSGPVWSRRVTSIGADDTSGALFARLADLGASALIATLPRIAAGEAAEPQPPEGITLAPKITREVARIRWNDSAHDVGGRIRAMDPAPGAWTTLDGAEVKCFAPTVVTDEISTLPPGTMTLQGESLMIAAGDGLVRVAEVQPSGRRRMPAAQWLRGNRTGLASRFV